jgi:hypothetical protein
MPLPKLVNTWETCRGRERGEPVDSCHSRHLLGAGVVQWGQHQKAHVLLVGATAYSEGRAESILPGGRRV